MARLMMYVLLMVAVCATTATGVRCYAGAIAGGNEQIYETYCRGSCMIMTVMYNGLYTHLLHLLLKPGFHYPS